jgi:imidazolonepropionase-like amidohydrolase
VKSATRQRLPAHRPLLFAWLALCAAPSLQAATALVGATVHPITGPAIERGVVVLDGGKISRVGPSDVIDDAVERIDVSGKHIYPGLIAAYSHLGLTEIEAVRATRDLVEAGQINPNASTHKAFTPDSELLPVTRSNGVLLALSAPAAGRVAGKSSLMRLAGWTWEDMLLEPDVALHVDWPRARRQDAEEDDEQDDHDHQDDPDKKPVDQVESLGRLFDRAQAYAAARRHDPTSGQTDLRLDALEPFVAGKRPVMVHAARQAEIEAAVSFFVGRGMRMILLGGYDADRCASLLTENDVPVILTGVYRTPQRRHQAYDDPYTLPARLHARGVRFSIAGSGRDATWNARNLPYHAATAAAFGLPRDEALKAITINAARVLGVADRVGSIEVGKEATLIITSGDPLEITTQVDRAFVHGVEIDLGDRQKWLRDKYNARIKGR